MPDDVASDARRTTTYGAGRPRLRLMLASPRGFCAGVRRAIAAVEDVLVHHGRPVYVRRPIVHNRAVMQSLEAKGAVFVEELDEVPANSVVLFSAHGVGRAVTAEADRRRLHWYDAICPLVAKVHREVVRHHLEGRHVILIGHRGHPEIAGTLGQLPIGAATVVGSAEEVRSLSIPNSLPVAYAVQTTFSVEEAGKVVDALLERFADIEAPPSSDICYASTNRQAAIREIASKVDAVMVVGEGFSSNAVRLADVARDAGCASVQLVADVSEVDWTLLAGASSLGLTAAASTPEASVASVLEALDRRFDLEMVEGPRIVESAVFRPMPLG